MKLNPQDLLAVVVSLALHVLVAALLWFGAPELFKAETPKVTPVKAVFLDTQRQVAAEKARQAEDQRRRKLEQERRRKAEELRKQKAEEARLKAEAEKKRKAEEARKKAQMEAQRKAEAEAKRQAEEKARQEALKKKKAAEEAARKKKAAEDAARKKRQQDDKRRLQEALLAEEAEIEAQRQASAQAKQDDSDRARYIEQLSQHIQRQWARPVGTDQDFSCKIQIRQLPGGQIQSYEIQESCGNSFLDASVESAIRKADPLPLPQNKRVFERTLNLIFKP